MLCETSGVIAFLYLAHDIVLFLCSEGRIWAQQSSPDMEVSYNLYTQDGPDPLSSATTICFDNVLFILLPEQQMTKLSPECV